MTPEAGARLVGATLQVSRVMTAGQARRLSGLDLEELQQAGLHTFDISVNMRHQQTTSRQRLVMVAIRARQARQTGGALMHVCGALELALGIEPAGRFDPARLSAPVRRPAGEVPDLMYTTSDGTVTAIEFDPGAYKIRTVHAKVSRFSREFDAVVYGTTIRGRHHDLTRDVARALSLEPAVGELRLGDASVTLRYLDTLE